LAGKYGFYEFRLLRRAKQWHDVIIADRLAQVIIRKTAQPFFRTSIALLALPTKLAATNSVVTSTLEIAEEARGDPAREATTVVIGLHPFVVGTPDGAAAMRRVLAQLKEDGSVWLTDTESVLKAIKLQ